jgi:Domain of unknown function (DUF4352)
VRRRSKTVAASATILIAAIIAAILLLATLQTALTSESTRREQNPLYIGGQPTVQAGLNKSATANNLTFRVTQVMNSNEPEARHVWDINRDMNNEYFPLNPISGNKYVIINATVASALNRNVTFSYSDVVLVGNDGRSYYANYAEGTANCSATIKSGELKAGDSCVVYIAFSVPNDVAPAKIVYTASKPAIVVNLA